jgi:hypothetical protein
MIQKQTLRCRTCGDLQRVTPTASPYEFDAVCACGRWLISWAHASEPPVFQKELDESGFVVHAVQQELFT